MHHSKIRFAVLGLMVAGVFVSVSTASASAGELFYYVGGAKIGSTPVPETTTGTTYVFAAPIGGVGVKFTSSGESGSGSIFNSTTGMTTAGGTLTFTGMTVNQPGCKIHSPGQAAGTIVSSSLENTTTRNASGEAGVRYVPAGGGATLFTIMLEGCTNTGLNNTFEVTGTIFGRVNNATSTLEFNTPSGEIKIGVNNATFKGTSVMSSAGKSVEIKE